jgi:DNA-binding Xre family transcriptional regulator
MENSIILKYNINCKKSVKLKKKKKNMPTKKEREIPRPGAIRTKERTRIQAIKNAYEDEVRKYARKGDLIEELAEYVGVERPNVYRLIRGGEVNFELATLDSLCKFFDLNILEVIAGAEYPTRYIPWRYEYNLKPSHFNLKEVTATANLYILRQPERTIRLSTFINLVKTYNLSSDMDWRNKLLFIISPVSERVRGKWLDEVKKRRELFGKNSKSKAFPDPVLKRA